VTLNQIEVGKEVQGHAGGRQLEQRQMIAGEKERWRSHRRTPLTTGARALGWNMPTLIVERRWQNEWTGRSTSRGRSRA